MLKKTSLALAVACTLFGFLPAANATTAASNGTGVCDTVSAVSASVSRSVSASVSGSTPAEVSKTIDSVSGGVVVSC